MIILLVIFLSIPFWGFAPVYLLASLFWGFERVDKAIGKLWTNGK